MIGRWVGGGMAGGWEIGNWGMGLIKRGFAFD